MNAYKAKYQSEENDQAKVRLVWMITTSDDEQG
jgi:hypothetical protein